VRCAYKRRIEARGVAVVVVACVLAAGAGRPAACAPRVVVADAVQDAGEVVAGARVERVFTLRNEGDAPLELTASAPPLVATARTDGVVAAGGRGHVRVEVDTLALGGPSTVTVPVATNDPARPHLDLALRLDVHHLVVASPGRARFVFVRGAPAVTVRERVRAVDGAPVRIRAARSPLPALAADFHDAELALTLRPEAPVGALSGNVEVEVDHPRQKRLVVPVSGFVRPVLAVTPPRLLVDGARPWRTRLHVRSFAEEPVEVRRATTDVPGLALAVVPLEAGRTYAVDVQGSGAGTGTIRLETTSPVEPVVAVAVLAGAAR
jgi:hypothetical protein